MSEIIKADEYSKMKWNIYEIPREVRITIHFPELYEIFKEFESGKDFDLTCMNKDQIFRYIVYTYHKRSPLVKKVTDIFQRKHLALKMVGVVDFELEEVKDIFTNDKPVLVEAILQFLKFECDMDFMALTLQVEAYYNWNKALVVDTGKSLDIKNRTSIFDTIQKVKKSIDQLSEIVFQNDTTLRDSIAKYQVVSERKALTPEERAAKRSTRS